MFPLFPWAGLWSKTGTSSPSFPKKAEQSRREHVTTGGVVLPVSCELRDKDLGVVIILTLFLITQPGRQ
ncbi:protein of unknown function [Rhodovastum atsumiense]|nr:protein of unknown function [Rhodovastum atsumiense]